MSIIIEEPNISVVEITAGVPGPKGNPGLAGTVFTAGIGLTLAAGVLAVNVDDVTLEIDTDVLQLKAGGINLAGALVTGILPEPAVAPELARTAAVTSAISVAIANLVDTSPATLDTLNELAAALGDDPNFATTITTSLAGKQPLNINLTTIAGLTPAADDFLQFKAGAWSNRTIAQVLIDLGLTGTYQPLDQDLTDIAALTTVAFGRSLLTLADAAALLSAAGAAAAVHVHAGSDITSGVVAAANIDATIARDTEVTAAVTTHAAVTTNVHGIVDTSALALTALVPILAPNSSARNTIQPTGAGFVPLTVKGAAAQTADLQQWQDSSGVILASIKNNGSLRLSKSGFPDIDFVNAGGQLTMTTNFRFIGYGFFGSGNPGAGIALGIKSPVATDTTLVLRGFTSQTADIQSWQDSGNTVLSRIDKNGYFMTRKVAAPADADLATSELAMWFDNTPGSAAIKFKSKNSAGTVVTATVALA